MRVTTLMAALLLGLGGCGSGSAGGARISGFQPIDPPVGFRVTSSLRSPLALSEPVVDSLQPTLKWEGMPGRNERHAGDRTPFVSASAERISDVTWEVEVYEAEGGQRGALVWHGEGLSEPQATIATPLKPGHLYLWTVRAAFLLDGVRRRSEWSVALWRAAPGGPSFWTAFNDRDVARASGSIPAGSMYRFRTPKAPE